MHARLAEVAVAPNYNRWLRDLALPWIGESVLEVGAGVGTMTAQFLGRRRIVALELEEQFAEQLRKQFVNNPEVEIAVGDASDPDFVMRLASPPFDGAVSYNVFEHIEDDVNAFRAVRSALRPGGHFVCYVPAGPSIYGSLDARLGHFRRYRRRELAEKAVAAGFTIAALHYVCLPGYFGWAFNSRLLRSDAFAGGSAAVGLWDRFVIPAARGLERIRKPPFGQSLLLVARRPEA